MSPVLGEQRRTSPTQSDQVIGCTFFWFVFFMQVKKMNIYKNDHFDLFISFFYVPKRRSKKRAPGCAGPSGTLALLTVAGTLKTHRLRRLRQVQRLIPSTAVMLSGTERDYNQKISNQYFRKQNKNNSYLHNDLKNLQCFINIMHVGNFPC